MKKNNSYPSQYLVQSKPSSPIISRMAMLFLAIFLTVLFEGAIRKWITTDFTTPLVMFRDSLALYGIIWAIVNGKMKLTLFTFALVIWTNCLVFWGVIQLFSGQSEPLTLVIGLRFWLLYLWFGYAAGVSLTKYDFYYVTKVMMMTLIIIAPIVIVQFFSPVYSFINKQIGDDETMVFVVVEGIVRTTGTFTFTLGQSIYLGILGPPVFSLLTAVNDFIVTKKQWIFIILGYLVALVLAGSRTIIFLAALQFIGFIFVEFLIIRRKNRTKSITLVLLFFALIGMSLVIFSSSFQASSERIKTANEQEDTFARIVYTVFAGEAPIEDIPLLGHGIGISTNVVNVNTNIDIFKYGEMDSTRIVMEGGVIGFVFIGLKIATGFAGLKKSLRASKAFGNTMPFLLWLTLVVGFLMWQTNSQLTVNALTYLLLALAIASLRINTSKPVIG